ncbi:MAG: hypothetical protein ABJF10_05510 [Chthoniobacter sp.]|uniref:hypothetical protein n=1 Tax=Chthoniobacter sp. TaxID=2510640 RepID=UPI0032AA943F
MISPVTGEVVFDDGLHFAPHEELTERHIRDARSHLLLPIPGWTHHVLGTHASSAGPFEVEAVSDRDSRIQVVLLSCATPPLPRLPSAAAGTSAHQLYHEIVIALDLFGQREFSWGEVFCRLDPAVRKDWLVIAYASGPHVPLPRARVVPHLHEHAPEPRDNSPQH